MVVTYNSALIETRADDSWPSTRSTSAPRLALCSDIGSCAELVTDPIWALTWVGLGGLEPPTSSLSGFLLHAHDLLGGTSGKLCVAREWPSMTLQRPLAWHGYGTACEVMASVQKPSRNSLHLLAEGSGGSPREPGVRFGERRIPCAAAQGGHDSRKLLWPPLSPRGRQ